MELLHCNVWWFDGLELIGSVFICDRALEPHRKGIQCVDNIWHSDFLLMGGGTN